MIFEKKKLLNLTWNRVFTKRSKRLQYFQYAEKLYLKYIIQVQNVWFELYKDNFETSNRRQITVPL
jgi:hypothetical protein